MHPPIIFEAIADLLFFISARVRSYPSPYPRRGLGRGFTQRNFNFLDYIVDASKHLVVSEAYDTKPTLFD
jgi:hypothetical protein